LIALYIASSEKGSGKTTIAAGIGKYLTDNGKKVGFLKPLAGPSSEGADSDCAFIHQLLALEESPEALCPAFKDEGAMKSGIKQALNKVSRNKDVVIVEGPLSRDVAEALDAKVVIVENYSNEPLKAAKDYQTLGQRLLGVILNKVPLKRQEQVRGEVLAQSGMNILGVLPEDRTLLALTVAELAAHIEGTIASGDDKSAELVENFMVGAMTPDSGLLYFGRKEHKAAIIKGERPDMQLAALETPTSCLVITKATAPQEKTLARAQEKGVPIVIVQDDVSSVAASLDEALSNSKFNQENKVPRLIELMGQNFDFSALDKGLGLTG
jgi:BioD-like phosphotransacetylase family protein